MGSGEKEKLVSGYRGIYVKPEPVPEPEYAVIPDTMRS
jgi:hypothetical protein